MKKQTLMVLLLTCFPCFGQLESLGNAALAQAQTLARSTSAAPAPTEMIWANDDPTRKGMFWDRGHAVKVMASERATVAVMLGSEWGKTSVNVYVACPEKGERFDIDPSQVHLVRGKEMFPVKQHDATKMARSAERWERMAAGLSTMGAGMQTQTATGTVNGEPVTITAPNTQARDNAKRDADRNISNTQGAGNALIAGALQKNTVLPGHSVIGNVYFDRQKQGTLVVYVEVAGTVFQFPFDAKTLQ